MPASRSRSATPAASGASGPMMTKSTASTSQNVATAPPSRMSSAAHSAICAIPALPGATISRSHFGICSAAQASACSRPPPPRMRMFIARTSLASPALRSRVARRRTQGGERAAAHERPDRGGRPPWQPARDVGVGDFRRGQAGDRGRIRPCAGARRIGPHRAPALGACLSRSQGRPLGSGGCDLEGCGRAPRHRSRGGDGGGGTGRLTTFGGQSRYQMVIEEMVPAGAGALMAMLEKRKKALAAEGLFDAGPKRALPYLPEVIGVVTSPTGAVIRDILHRLRERFPRKVLIWPVAVQGERCAPEVARAIRGFNALAPGGALPRPDLIIVARGGGSVEDLWGFNDEDVVRAAAESAIPLVSAVGHETDTTLIDFASDKRAPTPTAAAELAVPVRRDLLAWLDK